MLRKLFLSLLVISLLSSCHTARFFKWNVVNQNDYKKFDNLEINKGNHPFKFTNNTLDNNLQLPELIATRKGEKLSFNDALIKDKTIAFLVIKKDSILYEKYFYGFDKKSIQASFSMSKSFLSSLIAIAIEEEEINSVNDPITDYLDFLDKDKFKHITIENLLDMRSGILSKKDFFNPFGQIVKMYYGKNLKKYMHQLKIKTTSNTEYEYSNVNSQLLALILEKATGKLVTTYLEEKIWKPIGMEHNALWSIDSKKNKTIKAFCCMSATARDYAKIGRLYLNKGKWNDKQIIPKKWVEKVRDFKTTKNDFRYSYHWKHAVTYEVISDSTKYPNLFVPGGYFFDEHQQRKDFIIYPYPAFFAVGVFGQFTYVYPKKDIIIVRLGKKDKEIDWEELFKNIVEMN